MNRHYWFWMLAIWLFVGPSLHAQTPYAQGFKDGYKEGYCYDQSIGCIPPIAPLAPLPRINESSRSYRDGYNRGFLKGREDARREQAQYDGSSRSGQTCTNRNDYSAAFINPVVQPDYRLLALKAKVIRKLNQQAGEALRRENYDELWDIADRMLNIESGLSLGYFYRSIAKEKKGYFLSAYKDARKAYLIMPTKNTLLLLQHMAETMDDYLWLFYQRGAYDRLLKEAKKMGPFSGVGQFYQGLAYYYKGKGRKAKKHFKRAKSDDRATRYLDALKHNRYIPNTYLGENAPITYKRYKHHPGDAIASSGRMEKGSAVQVNTCAPVLVAPRENAAELLRACNGKVIYVAPAGDHYIKVRYGAQTGYLHTMWIKKNR